MPDLSDDFDGDGEYARILLERDSFPLTDEERLQREQQRAAARKPVRDERGRVIQPAADGSGSGKGVGVWTI